MTNNTHKQKHTTGVGIDYIDLIVLDLMSKSFDAYQKRDLIRSQFQTSIWEHANATAGILLIAITVETIRNEIYYYTNTAIKNHPVQELANTIHKKEQTFPKDKFVELLNEIFVMRDVIAHNHLYEVEVEYKGRDIQSIGQILLNGYGDKKYNNAVNPVTAKTKLLELNVQPAKIGFDDLFKVLVLFDLIDGVIRNVLWSRNDPLLVIHEIDGRWTENLSEVLVHYFDKLPTTASFTQNVEGVACLLRKDFAKYIPKTYSTKWFFTNICPNCSKLGFRKRPTLMSCSKCGANSH